MAVDDRKSYFTVYSAKHVISTGVIYTTAHQAQPSGSVTDAY